MRVLLILTARLRITRSRPQAYSRVQIALHWAAVLLVLGQYATSGAIVRTHSLHIIGQRQNPTDLILHLLHDRLGLLLAALMLARLAWRLWAGAPRGTLPAGSWPARLAGLVHGAFYAVLITEGASGALASYLWWPASRLHVVLFKILLGLIAVHVAAALWHQLVLKDGTLRRMAPGVLLRRQQTQTEG